MTNPLKTPAVKALLEARVMRIIGEVVIADLERRIVTNNLQSFADRPQTFQFRKVDVEKECDPTFLTINDFTRADFAAARSRLEEMRPQTKEQHETSK